MFYHVVFTKASKKDVKHLSSEVKQQLQTDHLVRLSTDPKTQAKKLKGEFKEYYSYKFSCEGVEYRIIFEIKDDTLLIIVILIGARENIYKKLKRRT